MRAVSRRARHPAGPGLGTGLRRQHARQYRRRDAHGVRPDSEFSRVVAALRLARGRGGGTRGVVALAAGKGRRMTRRIITGWLLLALPALAAEGVGGDYVERFDTLYNSLIIERKGTIVELRARARGGEALESAVDLSDPLRLVVPYTRTLFAALFIRPQPSRV